MELFILTRGATALVNLGYSLVAYGVMLLVAVKTDVYFSGIFLGFAAADFFCTREKGAKIRVGGE